MAVRDTNHRVTVTLTDAEYGEWRAFGTKQVSKEVMRRARAYDEMQKALYVAFTVELYKLAEDAKRDARMLGDMVNVADRFRRMADVRGDVYEGAAREVWSGLVDDMAARLDVEARESC